MQPQTAPQPQILATQNAHPRANYCAYLACWFLLQNDDDDLMPEMIKEGTMVRVYGTLKTFQGKQQITIARIHPIEDPNEITTHLLELTYSYLRAKKVSLCACMCVCVRRVRYSTADLCTDLPFPRHLSIAWTLFTRPSLSVK